MSEKQTTVSISPDGKQWHRLANIEPPEMMRIPLDTDVVMTYPCVITNVGFTIEMEPTVTVWYERDTEGDSHEPRSHLA
jgi:hypothetical protein